MSPELAKSADPHGGSDGAGRDPSARITRDDIVGKFRELQGETDVIADEAKSYALLIGAGVVAGLLVVAYVLGKRGGRKRRTVVEIRRV
jgi:hypothetical protein